MPTATRCEDDQPGPIASLPIPQVVAVNDVVGAAAPALVPVLAGGQGISGGRVRPAVEVAAGPRGRASSRASTEPRCRAGWSARPRAGSRTPASTAAPPSCPGRPPRTWRKVSPVAASAAYLEHLRDAWNARIAGKTAADRLENQEVFLTVPASFDPVARELTMEAAGKAGLKHVTLLEEPQAAFYAWLAVQGQKWRKQVKVGDIILVCDVGGGTTDFTLIAVTDEGGDLALSRLAVGEHILLGGDNMDLALAYAVAATLAPGHGGPRRRPARRAGPCLPRRPRRRCSPT